MQSAVSSHAPPSPESGAQTPRTHAAAHSELTLHVAPSGLRHVEATQDSAVVQSTMSSHAPPTPDGWTPPVLLTVAPEGKGVSDVVERFEAHFEHLKSHGSLAGRRRRSVEQRMRDLLRAQLWDVFMERVPVRVWEDSVQTLVEHRLSPHEAAERLRRLVGAP